MADAIPKVYYNQKDANKQTLDPMWWIYPEGEAYRHAIACCEQIEENQNFRRLKNVSYARMYGNQFNAGSANNIYARQQTSPRVQASRVTLNVVKATIDTVCAKISKNKPRPLFLTEKGSQPQRQKAKKLTQYVSGVFRDADVYAKGQLAFRDSAIFGSGFLKVIPDFENSRICTERVLPDEIIVDDSEAIYGAPRTLYHRRFMPRALLAALWGDTEDKKQLIITCDEGGSNLRPDKSKQDDLVYTIEAWHLPSAPDADDGKHILCIANTCLLFEGYKKSYFPIFPLYWTPPVIGFYGSGIVEEISGLQVEVNKLLRDIQSAMHRMCAPQIWIENGTHVSKPITNEFGAVYRYTGTAPTFYAPAAMAAEVYNHVWNIYKRAYEIVGVSELSATLKKPSGLESRAALREFNEIETERFSLVAQAYEKFYMSVAEAVVDFSEDIFKEKKDISVNVPGKKFIEKIHWEEVDMEKDNYVMEVFPTALLPSTPSGKLDRVQEMLEGGLIDRNYAVSLLDFPDIENVLALETASFENISMMIDRIIEKGEYHPPEQFMDLALAVKMAQQAYLREQVEGLEEDRLELLRTFMKQCLSLMAASKAPAAEQMAQEVNQVPGLANPGLPSDMPPEVPGAPAPVPPAAPAPTPPGQPLPPTGLM